MGSYRFREKSWTHELQTAIAGRFGVRVVVRWSDVGLCHVTEWEDGVVDEDTDQAIREYIDEWMVEHGPRRGTRTIERVKDFLRW